MPTVPDAAKDKLAADAGARKAKCIFADKVREKWKLFHWCMRNKVDLSAVHLLGEDNVEADALSRG